MLLVLTGAFVLMASSVAYNNKSTFWWNPTKLCHVVLNTSKKKVILCFPKSKHQLGSSWCCTPTRTWYMMLYSYKDQSFPCHCLLWRAINRCSDANSAVEYEVQFTPLLQFVSWCVIVGKKVVMILMIMSHLLRNPERFVWRPDGKSWLWHLPIIEISFRLHHEVRTSPHEGETILSI